MKRGIPSFDIMEMPSSESEFWDSLVDVSKSPKYPASFDRSLVRSLLSFLVLHSAWLKEDGNQIMRYFSRENKKMRRFCMAVLR